MVTLITAGEIFCEKDTFYFSLSNAISFANTQFYTQISYFLQVLDKEHQNSQVMQHFQSISSFKANYFQ